MDVNRDGSIYIPTKAPVSLDYRNPSGDVDFPRDWFTRNPGACPTATIRLYSGTRATLINSVRGGIRAGNLSPDTAKVFLYQYGLTMRTALDADWVSFGYTIGLNQAMITPWSILRVESNVEYNPTEDTVQAANAGRPPQPDDPNLWTELSMAMYVVGIYRLIRVTNDDYADQLVKRLENQVAAEGGKGISFYGVKGMYGSWVNDKDYLKMVAAIDMFLHRFRSHPSSILRMGTLGSRFRDCAGLLSFGFAMSFLNIGAGNLMDWVFVKTMADEVLRITTPNQEVGDKYSYFPYQSDFGLVTRSAYSSNANTYLFTWIHIVGTLLGHRRSQNARMIFEGSYSDIGLNAVLVAWVFDRGGALSPHFDREGVDYGATIKDSGPSDGKEGPETDQEDADWMNAQGRNPKTWFALLKSNGYQVPRVVKLAIRRRLEKIREPRADSVGDYVKNNFTF